MPCRNRKFRLDQVQLLAMLRQVSVVGACRDSASESAGGEIMSVRYCPGDGIQVTETTQVTGLKLGSEEAPWPFLIPQGIRGQVVEDNGEAELVIEIDLALFHGYKWRVPRASVTACLSPRSGKAGRPNGPEDKGGCP